MSTYGEIEDGVVVKEMIKPKWYFDDGGLVDDTYLATQNILPIIFNDPGEDFKIKPMEDWIINETNIEKTYWTFSGDEPVDYVSLIEDISVSESVGTDVITRSYTVTPLPLEEAKTKVKEYLADLRWKIETGGVLWDTNSIHTDRESQIKLFSSYLFSKDPGLTEPIKWKTINGFIELTNIELQNMSSTIKDFIQNVYDNESFLIAQIDSITLFNELKSLYNDLETTGWPSISIFLNI